MLHQKSNQRNCQQHGIQFCQRPGSVLGTSNATSLVHTGCAITNDPLGNNCSLSRYICLPSVVVGVRSLFLRCPRYVTLPVLVLVLALVAG